MAAEVNHAAAPAIPSVVSYAPVNNQPAPDEANDEELVPW
jgi:hypothetical protein